jgi:hypothetical protein
LTRRAKRLVLVSAALALLVGACGHKLVPEPGQHTVRIYPDEQSYQRLREIKNALKKQPGPFAGMVAGMGEQALSRELPIDTPVKIVSQDSVGAVVEVTSGPNKGVRGFVPIANLK